MSQKYTVKRSQYKKTLRIKYNRENIQIITHINIIAESMLY